MMWGPSIIGYGKHHYSYAEGRPAEICLKKLGKHKLSRGGCLYINKLKDIDVGVLKTIIEKSWGVRPSSGS